MDPYSEKHPLSDDEKCDSPREADSKTFERLSRTFSSSSSQGAPPKGYAAMSPETLEPKEKHTLSDDEKCESPRGADSKTVERQSRKTTTLCEDQDSQSISRAETFTNSLLPNEAGTFSSSFSQGVPPKEYGAMSPETLEPKGTVSVRFEHGARPKKYGSMSPKPLEQKGEDEFDASLRQYVRQKECSAIENFEQDELRLKRAVQSKRQGNSCSPISPAINDQTRRNYDPHEKDASRVFDPQKRSPERYGAVCSQLLPQAKTEGKELEHHDSPLRVRKLDEQRNYCYCPSCTTNLKDSRHMQFQEAKPVEAGPWMCAVNGELSKTESLHIARFLKLEKPDCDKIEKSANPGLELLHVMIKQDLIGPMCENLLKIFLDLNMLLAADKLKKNLPTSPPSSVPQRPYEFEQMIADLEQILDDSDSERVASYCEFSNKERFEVQSKGSSCLLQKLQAKKFLNPECVRRFAEALESLKLLQACRKVKEYGQTLHLPVIYVRITPKDVQNPSEMERQRKFGFIEDTFSKMMSAADEKLKKLNAYTKKNFNHSIAGISKGSLILHIRVSSTAHLDQLLQSINSGEFAKACSRILFPYKELELKGFREEVELTAFYDINSIERVKTGLEKSEYDTLEVGLNAKEVNTDVGKTKDENIQGISDGQDGDFTHNNTTINPRGDNKVTITIEKPISHHWNVALLISETFTGHFETVFMESQYVKYEGTRFILFQVNCGITVVGAGVLPREGENEPSLVILKYDSSPKAFTMDKLMANKGHKYKWFARNKQFKQKPNTKAYTVNNSVTHFLQCLQWSTTWKVEMERRRVELLPLENSSKPPVSIEKVSTEEDVLKNEVENQMKTLFDIPSGCTLKNVFWFPCTEKLVRRTLSIKETIKDAMLTFFKNNFTDHGVHMVPQYLGIRRSTKLRQKGIARKTLDFPVCDKQIEDNHYLSENQKLEILRKRIADRTVYEAALAVSKWAGDLELDVFIFTNYQYSDYLKNIAIATDIDGKHDILVISRDLGVIFIQVSSSMGKSRKVAKQQMQKKTQQLMKDKLVFLESNRDLSEVTSKIPVYQLAAFPNFRREVVLLDVCRGHSQSVLTKECFDSDNIFETLNKNISIPSEPCLSEKDYQYLCSRYVGIASTDNTRTTLDGTKTAFKILKKAFLTSEQRQILNMDDINSFVVLTGDYGTGKSLLLTQKALRIAKSIEENCKPCLVSCANLQRFGGLQTTFEDKPRGHLSIQKEILDKLNQNIATFSITYVEDQKAVQQSVNEMFVSMLKGFIEGMKKVHILLDEFPFIVIKEHPTILSSLFNIIPDEGHFWLSITTVSSTETELLEKLVSKQKWSSRRLQFFHLDKIMRMPETVVNLYSSVQDFISGQSFNKTIGHVVMGPKPMLFSLDACSCKELNKASLTCSCTKSRLVKALRNIMKVTGDIEHNNIAFYIHSITRFQEMFELLSDAMKSFNSSLKWWFEKESNSFSVLTENAHWHCERAVVISVDPFGMNHWEAGVGDRAIHTSVFSKCLSQYIHLVWPKEEAAELFHAELNALEEDLRLSYVKAKIMKENGDCRNTKSEDGCLEYLRNADLFMAGPQYE